MIWVQNKIVTTHCSYYFLFSNGTPSKGNIRTLKGYIKKLDIEEINEMKRSLI